MVLDVVANSELKQVNMSKKEFSQTKTVVSPDGKTITTMTVSGSSETTKNTSTVTTSTTTITVTTTKSED